MISIILTSSDGTYNTAIDKTYLTNLLKQQYQKQTFKFLPSKDYNLLHDGTTAVHKNSRVYNFVLADKPLTTNQTWSIKLNNQGSSVGIGVAFLEVLKLEPWDYSKLGHFAYIMTYNNYTWSHSDNETNYMRNGFHFDAPNTIQLIYNYYEQSLTFTCEDERYTMPNVPPNCHPCVMSSDESVSVTILS
jgi:hypothetical protein